MPLYEYECTSCGYRFEKMVSIACRDDVTCERCEGSVKRVYQGKCVFGATSGIKNEQVGVPGCSMGCPGCCGHGH